MFRLNYFSKETDKGGKKLFTKKQQQQKKKHETVNKFISAILRKILSNDTDETLRSESFSNGYGILSKEGIVRKKYL